MSARASICPLPLACSRDIYAGVPTAIPVSVSLAPLSGFKRPGDAEVSDPRVTIPQQDVLGLHVAVDYPWRCVVQGIGYFTSEPHGFIYRELPFSPQPVAQTLALHVAKLYPAPRR